MSLQPGARLGVFEILGPLGVGGMGEVYSARDTRLGREVAIKVLPETFARDPSRVARFEREARMLASINHPAIATIYGAEEAGDVRYLVMELVPGVTLDAMLARGPLALGESLQISRQIVDALEAAHEKGVVHRDLKPSNIKVTPDGKVKVLDLGLAKAMEMPGSGEGMSHSPTITLEQTRPGTILGTVEFMSPEQARGKEVDKRTDIWAFGCILFEMLSGRRPFAGETISDVLAAILTREPDWRALPASTPARVRELLSRCLEKDANKRLRDIGDARMEIEDAIESKPSASSRVLGRFSRRRVVVVAAIVLAVAIPLAWLFQRTMKERRPHGPRSVAVLFADLSGQANGQVYCDGLAATVRVRLTQVPTVQVTPPVGGVPISQAEEQLRKLARTLGAELVLWGTVQRLGNQLRVTYSLTDTVTGVPVASGVLGGTPEDLFEIQDQLAERVTAALNLRREEPSPSAIRAGLEEPAAHQAYLEALGHLQRFDKEASVDSAIALLTPLTGHIPESPLVQAALGKAYLYKYRLTENRTWADRAIAFCQTAKQLNVDLPEVHVTLGQLFTRTGQSADAILEFQRALSQQPESAEATLGLAEAYEQARRPAEAERTYRAAIRLLPSAWGGYRQLGSFYYKHARYEESVGMFRRVTELTPDNVRGWNSLGAAYHQMGRTDQALAAFQRSIAIQPNADAFSNLGTIYYFLGRYAESVRAFEQAVALAPDNYYLWANLGDAYRWAPGLRPKSSAAYEKSLRLAREKLAVNPNDAAVEMSLALTFCKLGDLLSGQQHLEKALRLDPTNVTNYYNAAIVAHLSGKKEDALEWLEKALEGGYGLTEVEKEPELSSLRKEAAFQALVAKRRAVQAARSKQ